MPNLEQMNRIYEQQINSKNNDNENFLKKFKDNEE